MHTYQICVSVINNNEMPYLSVYSDGNSLGVLGLNLHLFINTVEINKINKIKARIFALKTNYFKKITNMF